MTEEEIRHKLFNGEARSPEPVIRQHIRAVSFQRTSQHHGLARFKPLPVWWVTCVRGKLPPGGGISTTQYSVFLPHADTSPLIDRSVTSLAEADFNDWFEVIQPPHQMHSEIATGPDEFTGVTLPIIPEFKSPPLPHLFDTGTKITHRKGMRYRIVDIPREGVFLEATCEPFYAYRALYGERYTFLRAQQEMEDGRFTADA